jgi:protein gp37
MAKTSIEWADRVWNPLVGCSIVSPGCTNCYAMKMAARIERMREGSWRGMLAAGTPIPAGHYTGLTKPSKGGPVWTGKVAWAGDDKLMEPLRRKKPTRYFVNSMSDLFHESVPDEWIDKVFAVMALAPQHRFVVMTKRAKRMREYLSRPDVSVRVGLDALELVMEDHARNPKSEVGKGCIIKATDINPGALKLWPLPNVWLLVSVEDQRTADERIPELLATPAAIRGVSCEPMLGPIDFFGSEMDGPLVNGEPTLAQMSGPNGPYFIRYGASRLDWIIVGSESGPRARPCDLTWVSSIKDQCLLAGVPLYVENGRKISTPEMDGRTWTDFPQTIV